MDFNTSVATYNVLHAVSFPSNNSGLDFLANNPYSPTYRLENQPMYKLGAFLRAGFDSMVSNASSVIGYLSETISYSLNSTVSLYYPDDIGSPPVFKDSGMIGDITSFDSKDDDFALLVQNLNARFAAQNKIENEHISVKASHVNAIYTNIFLKDREEYDSPMALSDLPFINLTEVISTHAPILLDDTMHLKLKHIKKKYLVEHQETKQFINTNEIDTLLIHEVKFSYNIKNPDLSFSEAETRFENQIKADKNLSPEILEYFSAKLLEQYPLIQSEKLCKTLGSNTQNSINDIILSRTYSAHAQTTEDQLNQALGAYSKFSYSADIIKALFASISGGDKASAVPSDTHYNLNGAFYAVHREEPLKIVHCQNTVEMTQHSVDKETFSENRAGYYSPEFNVIVFKGETNSAVKNIFVPAFIHESGHAIMNRIFKNNCKPFFKTDESQHALYKQAEIDIFKNLAHRLMLEENAELLPFNTTENIIVAIKNAGLLNELITNEDGAIIKKLNVSEEEYLILEEFHSLIYHYPSDHISTELIIRIPQLLTQGVSTATLESYFKPLMIYWNHTVTPEVEKMVERVTPCLLGR